MAESAKQEKIRIHDIVTAKPVENMVDFYLERDVQESDWGAMLNEARRLKELGQLNDSLITIALTLRLLNDDLFKQIPIKTEDMHQLFTYVTKETTGLTLKAALIAKFNLFSLKGNYKFGNMDLDPEEQKWPLPQIQTWFYQTVESQESRDLKPEQLQATIELINSANEEPFMKGYMFALLKIADFDKPWNIQLGNCVSACKEELRKCRLEGDWVNFAENLFTLSVLATDKLDLEQDGLHTKLTLSLPIQKDHTNKLPETRKF